MKILITGITGFVGSYLAEYCLVRPNVKVYGTMLPNCPKNELKRMRPSDIPIVRGDCPKFKKQTGWKPEIDFKDTLKDVLGYWRNIK